MNRRWPRSGGSSKPSGDVALIGVSYFSAAPIGGTLASMRAPSLVAPILVLLGSVACAGIGPLAAAPLVAEAVRPEALAAPMEDGSVYVLAEGGPLTSKLTLRSIWRRKAGESCDGEYLVLSERDAQSRRGGVIGGSSYEGFVRCISPEGLKPE